MKKTKQIVTMLMGVLLLCGASAVSVFASEGNVESTLFQSETETDLATKEDSINVWNSGEVPESEVPDASISEPMLTIPEIQPFAEVTDYMPELKSGNYEKWIDRAKFPDYAVSFYNAMLEGADNDGYEDFLIDETSSSLVESILIYETASNGTRSQVNATGVNVATITTRGSTWDEAYNKINELYYEAYYTMRTAFEAFDRDHPEVYWLSGSYYMVIPEYSYYSQWNAGNNAYDYYYTGDVYLILESPIFNIRSAAYQTANLRTSIQALNQRVNGILSGAAGKTDEEKIKYFNYWLTRNNEYNYRIGKNHEDTVTVMNAYPDAFECTAAITGLTGNYGPVCESYARAMKVLCDRSGIPCVLVDGYAKNALTATGENHMWNYVKLDGAWYAVDVTWNDPLSGNAGAVSGNECEDYMLLGGDNQAKVGGGTMRFLDSHPVRNKQFSDSMGLTNGPVLSSDRYVATMKYLTLTTNLTSVAYGYTELPVLTASAEKLDGQTGNISYAWYVVDSYGNETKLIGQTSNVLVFPEDLSFGSQTIRVKATLGGCTKSADVQIQVIRTTFSDVPESAYFYKPVIWAVLNNVTAGYYQDLFAPNMNCTRGQVVTFLWRACGCPEPETTENPFWDVESSDYFYKAVLWASENGITAGYTETSFAPDMTITRAQFATFLWRAEGKPSYSVENPFSDIEEGKYYYKAVLWAVENGITAGYYQDLFAPEIGCTRGQVVSFLYRNRAV